MTEWALVVSKSCRWQVFCRWWVRARSPHATHLTSNGRTQVRNPVPLEEITQRVDEWGIFTVSLAERVAPVVPVA